MLLFDRHRNIVGEKYIESIYETPYTVKIMHCVLRDYSANLQLNFVPSADNEIKLHHVSFEYLHTERTPVFNNDGPLAKPIQFNINLIDNDNAVSSFMSIDHNISARHNSTEQLKKLAKSSIQLKQMLKTKKTVLSAEHVHTLSDNILNHLANITKQYLDPTTSDSVVSERLIASFIPNVSRALDIFIEMLQPIPVQRLTDFV